MSRQSHVSTIGDKWVTTECVTRQMLTPAPGTAGARYAYTQKFITRAAVKTMGSSKWADVEIDGTKATHVFTIRYTSIAFDVRDRLRTVDGTLFRILKIENVEFRNRELKITCAEVGLQDVEAAR